MNKNYAILLIYAIFFYKIYNYTILTIRLIQSILVQIRYMYTFVYILINNLLTTYSQKFNHYIIKTTIFIIKKYKYLGFSHE